MEITSCLQDIVVFYTHIPAAVIALFLGCFLLLQNNHLKIRIFFTLAIALSAFTVTDLIRQLPFLGMESIVAAQSLLLILEPLIMAITVYFFYYLIKRKDAPFYLKVVGLMPLIPIFAFIILGKVIIGYDRSTCMGIIEPNLIFYGFVVSLAYLLIALAFATSHIMKDRGVRKEKLATSLGCIFFMLIFFLTQNVFNGRFFTISPYHDYLIYSFYLLPFLLAVLAYLAVRFKSYRIRVATNQIFIMSVFLLIFSLFFFLDNTIAIILNIFLIFFMAIISNIIMMSVKEEIKIREQVEELAQNLVAANQNSKKTNIKLEELSLQKTEFVSLATHQLRGPLSSLSGYASMILDGDFGKVDGKLREAITTMLKSSQSLASIVDDYLNISRIELGQMKFDFSVFDLSSLVKTLVSEYMPTVSRANLELDFTYDKNHTYLVKADMGKVKQVISNLLDNSIKYTPTGKICLHLEKKTGKICFKISDTGVGIDPEVMPDLFARFSRAPDASKTNLLGTGLGLYVVKKLVEAHNGKVWAESAGTGNGSQFYLELEECKEN